MLISSPPFFSARITLWSAGQQEKLSDSHTTAWTDGKKKPRWGGVCCFQYFYIQPLSFSVGEGYFF